MSDKTLHVDTLSFAMAVERMAVCYRKARDQDGLVVLAEPSHVDISRALRRALVEQGKRDGYTVIIDGWDELTKWRLVSDHAVAMYGAEQPTSVEPEE